MDQFLSLLIKLAIITLFFAIILFGIRWIIGSISRMNEMRKKQNLSVIARWRNKVTESMWKDLMDIRIAGIVPVGEKVEDFLYSMFPRSMEDLERLRVQNPVAWRETMVYLAPLMVRIKATATYKGQDALNYIIKGIESAVSGNNSPDKDGAEDPDKGRAGGR